MNNPEIQERRSVEQKIDYYKILRILRSRWYWVVCSTLFSLLIGYLYLWYTPPVYSTTGSLKFDEKRSELTDLLQKGPNYTRNNKIQSEGFVIQSRDVLLNAIGRLDYKISYYLKGRVRTTDVYPHKPFPIDIVTIDSNSFYRDPINIETIDAKRFKISYQAGNTEIDETHSVGQVISLPGVQFTVRSIDVVNEGKYFFKFNTKEDFLSRANTVSTKEAAKSANVMQLYLSDKNAAFAIDLLNAIMQEYVDFDVRQRGTSASQTIDFISKQLEFLYKKVQESGGALEEYKKNNKIIDLETSTEQSVRQYSQQQAQRQELKLEELAINQLEEQVKNNKDQININFNLEGTLGGLLQTLIFQLNDYIKQRSVKLTQFNPQSAPIQLLDKQIVDTKAAIINNIRLSKERNKKIQRFIDEQLTKSQAALNSLPTAEREFAHLQSEFTINQKVFTYLSEKRLEAQITRAAVVPGALIVDSAVGASLISPVPGKVYTNALLVGLVFGIGLIFAVRAFNSFIYDKETVERLTTIPIIGVIRKFPGYIDNDNRQALSLQQPKSVFAESVRSVRTNLSFLASEKDSKVICITSEIAGEGKSFVSVNLASTLSLIDKKVVLLGADLRKSKLHRTFKVKNDSGLSTYLSNQSDLNSIIFKTEAEGLDFIPAGPVPPNPSELLHSARMKTLLQELKKTYDYILIDTAPVGLVSDSIPIIRNSDINLFVIRSGASRFNSVSIPEKLSNEYNLNNVVIVLNAFGDDTLYSDYYRSNTGGYYRQYYYSDYSGYSSSGYYVEEVEIKRWQFWRKKKKELTE